MRRLLMRIKTSLSVALLASTCLLMVRQGTHTATLNGIAAVLVKNLTAEKWFPGAAAWNGKSEIAATAPASQRAVPEEVARLSLRTNQGRIAKTLPPAQMRDFLREMVRATRQQLWRVRLNTGERNEYQKTNERDQ